MAFVGADQLLPVKADAAADDFAGGGQDLHDGIGGHRFAGTGFAHDTEHAAAVQFKGNAVHRLDLAGVGKKGGAQVFYFKQCHNRSWTFQRIRDNQALSLGSKASRSPSPNRFRDSTTRQMTIAGIISR